MTDIDLTTYDDETLDALRVAVITEQERRQARDTIPATIADLKTKYVEAGGDPADLP